MTLLLSLNKRIEDQELSKEETNHKNEMNEQKNEQTNQQMNERRMND